MMTLQQTINSPADRRVHFDLPETSAPRLLTQAEFEAGLPCTMDHTPNSETIAAIQEVQDIIDGNIPSKSMTVEEFLKDLHG
jgi:hypothetical protein